VAVLSEASPQRSPRTHLGFDHPAARSANGIRAIADVVILRLALRKPATCSRRHVVLQDASPWALSVVFGFPLAPHFHDSLGSALEAE
jgi:hypothetical protein